MKLTPNERKVLAFLADNYSLDMGVYPFAPIMRETGLDRAAVRRACRSLRRKGLTEFHSGCWNYDGEPVGSGYCATKRLSEIGGLT